MVIYCAHICEFNDPKLNNIHWKNSDLADSWSVQKLKVTMVPPPIVINLCGGDADHGVGDIGIGDNADDDVWADDVGYD